MGEDAAGTLARSHGSDHVQPLDFRHLQQHAEQLKMGHPARMKAITAGKKKNDKLDARAIANLLRCNLLPECFVMPPELAGMLMLAGLVEYEKKRLHGKKYFATADDGSATARPAERPPVTGRMR
jgi:hypothetical protein